MEERQYTYEEVYRGVLSYFDGDEQQAASGYRNTSTRTAWTR